MTSTMLITTNELVPIRFPVISKAIHSLDWGYLHSWMGG